MTAAAAMAAPRTVGKYEIVDELARGGMGAVYRGLQPSLGRMVAIKALLPGFAGDPELESRFRNEAGAIALLSHENIVRIHDVAEDAAGTWYIVMELVGGPSLRRVMDGAGALAPERAADLAIQVAAALGVAHARGIVHRDIKPANLLFSTAGVLKVMDFGVAKVATARLRTVTGTVLGTPAYMSPEQAQGERVDARSDLYALATLLFEMLAGRLPFAGGDAISLALRHIGMPPPDPRDFVPEIPSGLAEIVLHGLAKPREDRFQSAAELAAALAPYADAGRRRLPEAGIFAQGAVCPRCATPVRADFAVCPSCAASLETTCSGCLEPRHTGYLACPYCWTPADAPGGERRRVDADAPTVKTPPPRPPALRCVGCGEALAADFLRCPFCGAGVPERGPA